MRGRPCIKCLSTFIDGSETPSTWEIAQYSRLAEQVSHRNKMARGRVSGTAGLRHLRRGPQNPQVFQVSDDVRSFIAFPM
jgi:hypothetical protein